MISPAQSALSRNDSGGSLGAAASTEYGANEEIRRRAIPTGSMPDGAARTRLGDWCGDMSPGTVRIAEDLPTVADLTICQPFRTRDALCESGTRT
jgi:hypothetical protein